MRKNISSLIRSGKIEFEDSKLTLLVVGANSTANTDRRELEKKEIFIYSLAFLKAPFISCANDSARSRDRATMTIFILILMSKSESASIPAYGSDTRGTAVVCHQRGTPTANNNTAKEMLA